MKNDSFNVNKLCALPVAIVCLSSVLASCKDEEEGRITIDDTPPQQVTDVKFASGPGEVYLSWTNPDTLSNSSFMYTKVEYLDAKGEKQYHLISKERAVDHVVKDTVRGFATTEARTFSLYTCTVRGKHGEAVEVSVSPNEPAFSEVAQTVHLKPDLGGIVVSWSNPYEVPVNIVLEYHAVADAGKSGKTVVAVKGKGEGSEFVALTYGDNQVLSGEECVVNVSGQDEAGNSSVPIEFKVTPTAVVKLDRTAWTFPGYVDNSSDGTIGYSSQEAGGEGASPKGRVIAMLDGDLNSFWHASWKVKTQYPHWFIVDMGKDVTVSSVEIIRRQGKDGAKCQVGQRFYTCTASGATNPSNSDAWSWEDQGHFAFDATIETPQTFRLSANPVCRYIKVYFGEEDKGTGDQAMVAEFNVYGAE